MRHFIMALAFALGLSFSVPAWSQSEGVSDTVTTSTITNVSGNCLAANGNRHSLTLDASGSSVNLGYCETNAAVPGTPCTAAINSAGTTTLPAGGMHYWPAHSAPQNQFCFIATSGSQPLTIREGY